MDTLTQDQIEAVIDWMNTYNELKNSHIPMRFKEDWTKQLGITNTKFHIEKPPLGLTPKWIVDIKRQKEILAAITRYMEAGKKPPKEWGIEFATYCK